MEHETLQDILQQVEDGDTTSAREALRPFLTGAHEAPTHEVRYVLGRAWMESDKATARYLFEAALTVKPDYAEAGRYEAQCGSGLHDLEDFHDGHHPPCTRCTLRFREAESACPYCGAEAPQPERDDSDRFEAQLRAAGQEVVDSLKSFSEREDVQRVRSKAVDAGKQAYTRARELAESDKARELRGKAEAVGKRTMDKAREIGERKEVKGALHRTRESTQSFMQRAQAFVTEEQGRINKAEGAEKAWLIGRWFLAGFLLLLLLKWLVGGD